MPTSDPTVPYEPAVPLTEDISPMGGDCSRLGQTWRQIDLLALSLCERPWIGFGDTLGSFGYGLTGISYGLGDVGGSTWGPSFLAYP